MESLNTGLAYWSDLDIAYIAYLILSNLTNIAPQLFGLFKTRLTLCCLFIYSHVQKVMASEMTTSCVYIHKYTSIVLQSCFYISLQLQLQIVQLCMELCLSLLQLIQCVLCTIMDSLTEQKCSNVIHTLSRLGTSFQESSMLLYM